MHLILHYFFFSSKRRHTRCLSDWSSDVCSSDLPARRAREPARQSRIPDGLRRVAPAGAPAGATPPRAGERPHGGHSLLPGAPGGRSEAHRGEPRAGAGQARARAVRPAATCDLDPRRYRQGDRQDDRAADARRHPDRCARTVNRRALFQVMTTLDLTGLVRPHLVEMTKREDNPNAAEFRLQPLERGYGYTLGNSLRRMLLSSLRGAAVWAFRLDGVVHEHQTIPGVVEDVHQIIQRLKQLTLVLSPDVDEAVMHIKHDRAGPVYARDIEAHSAVTIVNPDQLLFTVQDDRDIGGELYVNKGRGYVEAEQHPVDRTMPVDVVRVDSIYNPVRRANFTVAETRVGQRTDYDRLTLTVETKRTISPEDAVAYAAALAQEHFRFFVDFGKVPMVAAQPAGNGGAAPSRLREVLARSIDDVGLSVRSVNSLKNSNIRTLADLVQYREEDLLKVKNVGEKALGEITELLRREGLNFGMKFEEAADDIMVVDPGVAPQAQATEGDLE